MNKNICLSLLFLILLNNIQTIFSQNEFISYSEESRDLYNSKKYLELIDYTNSKLPEVINKNDSVEIAKLYFEKAKGLYHKSRHDESNQALRKANIYLSHLEGNIRLKADVMYFIYINYGIKSYILKELEYGQKSLDLYESESKHEKDYYRIFIIYRRLANPNVTIGNYEAAKAYINKAQNLLNNLPENHNIPEPLINQTINLGYQNIVVDLIETAFFADNYDSTTIKKITKRVVDEKQKQDSIYFANTKLVNGKRIKTNPKINFQSYTSALNFYCRYYIVNQEKIDFDLSELHNDINKSIELLLEGDYKRYLQLYKGNRVDVLTYEKDYEGALSLIDQIIDKAGENHNRYVNFLFQKAGILFKKEDYKKAKVYILKGIEKLHSGTEPLKNDYSNFEPGSKLEDVYMLVKVADRFYGKSTINEAEKNIELSRIYKVAFKQFLNTYSSQPLNKRTQSIFKKIIEKLLEYNTLTVDEISKIEHVQNKLAWQKFVQSRNVVQLPVIDSLEQIDFQLRKQLVKAKRQRKLKQIDSINNAIEQYQEQLQITYPKLANFTQDNFKINEFQNKIATDEMVLKYMFFKEKFAIFQITKDTVLWKLYPWKSEQKRLLANHLKQIKTPAKTLQLNDSLTQLLLPKAALKYKVLTIIPDYPIYQLPFETLMSKNRFLIEDKAIRYSSHLRFVYINDDNFNGDHTKTKVSIFAPEYPRRNTTYATRSVPYYLEGAQQEAKVIETLFTAVSFTGDKATKQQFVNHKSESTVLHMAMHATIDESNPEFSHFNFSNNEKLYLEELYGLKIPNELAVLSACNTGVGKVEGASGMASLQRALNFAGTKATIASLWEVPDKTTSNIMISFYKHLKQGKTKSEALKHAKQEYLNTTSDYKLRHPYYWGGFVLYGDDAPILFKSNSNILYGVLAIIAVVFVGGFLIRYRKKQVA